MPDQKPFVIYHAHCVDGFAAAWVAHKYFGKDAADFHAASYGETPPEVDGRNIFILDFSYPLDDLEVLAINNRTVVVLDHHKTAQEALSVLPGPVSVDVWQQGRRGGYLTPLMALFDMNRSGAGLAWDWFFPDKPRPDLIRYVEDRDLWRFNLRGTRNLHAALSSHPFDFEIWDWLMLKATNPLGLEDLIVEGTAIERRHQQLIGETIAATRRTMVIGGQPVPVCNANYFLASDIGNELARDAPFAATYVDYEGGRQFSLRSTNEGLDVSAIAKHYGGGGHRNAAGFTASRGWEGDHPMEDKDG